jgi:2-hydroxy-4-carboxymuconate semialdehyde hemiacetal dehydrogenase
MRMKVVMAGQDAFGVKHLEAMAKIPDMEVVSLVGGSAESTESFPEELGTQAEFASQLGSPGSACG